MYPGIILAELAERGKLSFNSKKRIETGINFLKRNLIDCLILSGGVKKRPDHEKIIGDYKSFAKIMKEYALKKGVDEKKIILEDLSEETAGELIFLKHGIFEPKKINSGIIITHDEHAPRIFEMVEKVFGENHTFNYFLISSDKKYRNKRKTIEAFRKTFFGINFNSKKEVLETLFTKHPFYNHSPGFYRQELNKMIAKNYCEK